MNFDSADSKFCCVCFQSEQSKVVNFRYPCFQNYLTHLRQTHLTQRLSIGLEVAFPMGYEQPKIRAESHESAESA